MIDMYGLAAAYLSELQRSEEEEMARLERDPEPVVARRRGVIGRINRTLSRQAPLWRAMLPVAQPGSGAAGNGPASAEPETHARPAPGSCGRMAA
jgi:hypothetical protein